MSTLAEQTIEVLKNEFDEVYQAGYDKGVESGGGTELLDAFIDGSITDANSNATSVRQQCFVNCQSLTRVCFPLATTFANNVFTNCASLKEVELSLVTTIGPNCFYGCSSLTTIVIRTSVLCELGNANVFNNTPIKSGTGYIYVPSSLIDQYKVATYWSTYANQFRALEDYTVDGTINGELDESKI